MMVVERINQDVQVGNESLRIRIRFCVVIHLAQMFDAMA